MNQIVLSAGHDRKRIRFLYDNEFRTVEPHCYRFSAGSPESLVGFQLGANAWRWFHVAWMTRISPMSESFDPRPDYARDVHELAEVFAQV